MLIEAENVEIVKLQEDLQQFTTTYNILSLSDFTSGWTVCKEYTAGLWVKKINWGSAYDLQLRISNNAS